MLGRSRLRENRLEEGVEIYTSILKDYPDDLESILILADLYNAVKDYRAAASLYQQALTLDPANENIKNRVEEIRLRVDFITPSISPTSPQAIRRLLQQLSGRPEPPSEEEVDRAAELMTEIITSESPSRSVAQHLDEIDTLLPALLEMNICQAYNEGRPDLAEGLLHLQTNIALQLQQALPEKTVTRSVVRKTEAFHPTVQLLAPNANQISARTAMAVEAIESTGGNVIFTRDTLHLDEKRPDIVFASNPFLYPRMLESIALFATAKIPVITDLDSDFEHMPIDHRDYARFGLSSQASAVAYSTMLLLANTITVSSEFEARTLKSNGYPAAAIPDCWWKMNRQWDQQRSPSSKLHLGWVSTFGQLQDFLEIRRILGRILHEFNHVQLTIIGDESAYRLFDNFPVEQKNFIPEIDPIDMPLLFNQIDVLLLPYRNIPYNCSLSDQPVMMAGVKKIPWVASAIPSLTDWGKGGMISHTPEEWHANLRQLILDESLRAALGAEGRQLAAGRELDVIKTRWQEIIQKTMRSQRPE